MMFELNANDVIKADGDGAPFQGYARLLAVRGKFAHLIGLPLTSGKAPRIIRYRLKAPFRVRIRELARAIDAGLVDTGCRLDGGLLHSEDQYDGPARKRLEENYNLILPLLKDEEWLLDSPELGEALRGRIPKRIGRKEAASALRRLRRIMYIFWANGRTAASLAPAFHLRGAVAAQRPGTPRRGRRSKESGGSEIALPEVRERLIAGCKRFYRPGRYTMAEAYVETLETYFKAEIRSLHGGSLQTAQLPVPFLPTERQFRYICGLEDRRLGKRLKKPRKARAEAVKEVRRGRARDGVDGPGHRFEIDATGLQIQLVSYWDPLKLVGEPWLYLVIDVWSGLIAGYVLSLEDPCWELSQKALRSCCSDKAAVYESVQLPPGEWPCHHLPRGLTSDNAELLGLKAEQIQRMGITDEFSPGYRPKAKGTIESTFGRIKQDIFSKLPGAHPKNPGRRESDGKKGAALNIRQLERITVIAITKYNRAKIDSKIIPLDARAADLPKMSRNALYAWGLKNRFGFTLKLDPLEIPEYLMTRGEATVADGGFRFKGQIYISERAVPGNYRVLEGSGARKVDIRYDGHNASEILFYDVGRNGWAAARHENEHIRNLMPTFNELKVHKDEFKKLGTHTRYAEISKSSEERKEIIDPMCRDSNRVKAALKGTPKSGKEEIRSNRRTEKAGLRQLNSRKSKTEKVEAPHAGHTDASPESDEVEQMVADAVDASWEESDG